MGEYETGIPGSQRHAHHLACRRPSDGVECMIDSTLYVALLGGDRVRFESIYVGDE